MKTGTKSTVIILATLLLGEGAGFLHREIEVGEIALHILGTAHELASAIWRPSCCSTGSAAALKSARRRQISVPGPASLSRVKYTQSPSGDQIGP